jgi:hypothetical protein
MPPKKSTLQNKDTAITQSSPPASLEPAKQVTILALLRKPESLPSSDCSSVPLTIKYEPVLKLEKAQTASSPSSKPIKVTPVHPHQNLALGSSSSQTLVELDKISGTESSASRDGSAFDELSQSVKDRDREYAKFKRTMMTTEDPDLAKRWSQACQDNFKEGQHLFFGKWECWQYVCQDADHFQLVNVSE